MDKSETSVIAFKINNGDLEILDRIAANNYQNRSEMIRFFIKEGMKEKVTKQHENLIAHIVREQMEIAIEPHIERLARISVKSGLMSGRAAFLNAQVLVDLVPAENRRNISELWDKAQKKAVEHMKMSVEQHG